MKIFYVVDPSGTIKSSDGTKTYKALRGKALKDFLSSEEGKKRHFYINKDEKKNCIGVEVSLEIYRELKKDIDRETYLKSVREQLDISETSIENMLLEDGEGNGEEILEDKRQNLDEALISKEEKAILKTALKSLTVEERRVICLLYLVEQRLTERQVAKLLGISQKNVNTRKKKILAKIESFFKK